MMMSNTEHADIIPDVSEPDTFVGSETSATSDSFHPLFSSPEANIVLAAKDGPRFRVHAHTLKITSGWFRAMLSLPQDSASSSSPSEIIYVDEDAFTLEALLRMICGLPLPRLDPDETIEPILFAAEKYDMAGPLSIIRACLLPRPLLNDPLKLYAMTCRYGWEDEMRTAATQTLALNIHAPEYRPALRKLTTEALLALMELHHERRIQLRKMLNEPPFVKDSGNGTCSNCHSMVDYNTWRELKFIIDQEIETRPLGDTIVQDGLINWPAAKACWNAKCQDCQRELYDQKETIRAISACIEKLPKTIGDVCSDILTIASVPTVG